MRMVPVVFRWTWAALPDSGELKLVMMPETRYEKVARRQFHENEDYPLVVLEARSRASHNQYFAAIDDAWHNLPESIAARWPSAEHLRKWALIETGWFDEKDFDCDTPSHARNLATFIRSVDEYARIHLSGKKVIVRTAKSQSAASMAKEPFEKSKRDVLDLLATMTGTTRATLKKEAGRSA
jgi:hypothetical protein